MKTGKKIAVGLAAAFAIAIFAAGAVSMVGAIPAPEAFVVVVKGAPDVTVTVGIGGVDFTDLQKGESKTLSDSLVLTNTGDADAKVEARFIPSVGGVYGLVNSALDEVIPGSNVEVGTTSNEVALDDAGADVDLGADNYVLASGDKSYNAKVFIPANQKADTYAALIELTISAA